MAELPTGTVTFLFTDLEGSTRAWDQHAGPMKGALARHDAVLRAAIERQGAAERILGANMPSEYASQLYERATAILDERLGVQRRAELNARGREMDETESTDLAVATIERVVAARSENPDQR